MLLCGQQHDGREPRYSSLTRPTFGRMRTCGASGRCGENRPWWTPTSPRRGEKASYYSAVCLETGEVEVMELDGNSNAATSTAFLRQLRARHTEPLTVIWDNSPAHRGDALRAYLTTPGLNLRLVNLPSYSPDFNADEAIWGWVRPGGDRELVPGDQGRGAGEGGRLFRELGWPTGGSQVPMPNRPPGSRGRTDRQRPSRFLRPCECRIHLGFSLVPAPDRWPDRYRAGLGNRTHPWGLGSASTGWVQGGCHGDTRLRSAR